VTRGIQTAGGTKSDQDGGQDGEVPTGDPAGEQTLNSLEGWEGDCLEVDVSASASFFPFSDAKTMVCNRIVLGHLGN